MGEHCIEHESIRAVNLPRGRPVPTWMKGSTMIEDESWTDDDSCFTLSPGPLSQAV
jgi:hypothetical protein